MTSQMRRKLHGSLPSKLRQVSSNLGQAIFGITPSHLRLLLQCELILLRVASRWDHLGACRAVVCSLLILSLVIRMSFPERERERNPQHRNLWGVYMYLSWSAGTAYNIWVASRLVPRDLILAEFNLAIFSRPPNRQIAKLKPHQIQEQVGRNSSWW